MSLPLLISKQLFVAIFTKNRKFATRFQTYIAKLCHYCTVVKDYTVYILYGALYYACIKRAPSQSSKVPREMSNSRDSFVN